MALIKCSECEKEFSDKASFCPNCGNPITLDNVCPECNSFDFDGEVCLNCGFESIEEKHNNNVSSGDEIELSISNSKKIKSCSEVLNVLSLVLVILIGLLAIVAGIINDSFTLFLEGLIIGIVLWIPCFVTKIFLECISNIELNLAMINKNTKK